MAFLTAKEACFYLCSDGMAFVAFFLFFTHKFGCRDNPQTQSVQFFLEYFLVFINMFLTSH